MKHRTRHRVPPPPRLVGGRHRRRAQGARGHGQEPPVPRHRHPPLPPPPPPRLRGALVNDDRISRYLHQQAEGIALTPADPAGAMRRGTRRRTRRRAGLVGSVAVRRRAGHVGRRARRQRRPDGRARLRRHAPPRRRSTGASSPRRPASARRRRRCSWPTAASTPLDRARARTDRTTSAGPSTLYRSTDGAEWSPGRPARPASARPPRRRRATRSTASAPSPAGGTRACRRAPTAPASWSSSDLPERRGRPRGPAPRHRSSLGQVEHRRPGRDPPRRRHHAPARTSTSAKYRPEYSRRRLHVAVGRRRA